MCLSWLLSLSFSMQCWRQCPLPPAPPSAALGSSASPPSMRSTITKLIELSLSKVAETNKTFSFFSSHRFSGPHPRMHHYNHSLTRDAHTYLRSIGSCAFSRLRCMKCDTNHHYYFITANHNVTEAKSLLPDKINEQNSEIRCRLPPGGDTLSQSRWQLDLFSSVAACDIITLLSFGVFGWFLRCLMFACSLSHHHRCRHGFHQTYLAVSCALRGSPSSCMTSA